MEISSNNFVSLIKSLFNHPDELDEPPPAQDNEGDNYLRKLEDFYDSNVREIMIPRTQMVTVEKNATLQEAIQTINSSGHSRIPVQENKRDNIVGILYAKDILQHFDHCNNKESQTVGDIMRKPYFASYSESLQQSLSNFRRDRIHLAVIVDEYGGVAGLVTFEDIIEQLIGDIDDEYDQTTKPSYRKDNNTNEVVMDASYGLDEFNEIYHTNFEKEGIETIGGYICHIAGVIPTQNEKLVIGDIKFIIEERNDRQLTKIRFQQPDTSIS